MKTSTFHILKEHVTWDQAIAVMHSPLSEYCIVCHGCLKVYGNYINCVVHIIYNCTGNCRSCIL